MNKPVILCVDDERLVLQTIREQLMDNFSKEYDIEIAESGGEALELFDELLEDDIEVPLVIADYIMQTMNGDELLKQIHIKAPKTIKIMLTGQADKEAIINVVNHANLYHYINKPWVLQDLILTVSEALSRYFMRQQLDDQNQALKEINAVLSAKNQALIQLNQEKNEFLGIAAHDLKNPISAITAFANEIQDTETSKEDTIKFANIIQNASERMFSLIKKLLDVNMIESGKTDISLIPVDILPILNILLDQYSKKAKPKNIQLLYKFTDKKYLALADKEAINQVLDNLISNAVKYSPQGKNIFIRLIQEKDFIRCEIEDEGPGLSNEDQKKLFGKFARLSSIPTGEETSTGLGLFIVKKLIDAMKGKVWCESEFGKGTRFIVEFGKV